MFGSGFLILNIISFNFCIGRKACKMPIVIPIIAILSGIFYPSDKQIKNTKLEMLNIGRIPSISSVISIESVYPWEFLTDLLLNILFFSIQYRQNIFIKLYKINIG